MGLGSLGFFGELEKGLIWTFSNDINKEDSRWSGELGEFVGFGIFFKLEEGLLEISSYE